MIEPEHDPATTWVNPRAMPETPGVTLRLIDREADYPLLVAWWQKHGFPPVGVDRLPGLSVIASRDGKDGAFACCYMDNSGSGLGMIEWMVTNPDVSPRIGATCLAAAVAWLLWRAGEPDLRFNFFLTSCRQPTLCRLMERCGFQQSDTGMTHLVAS